MATATPPARRPEPDDALRTYHPLAKLRGSIRRYVALDGLATVGVFLALWFWIGLVIDYGAFKAFSWDWVQEAPRALRGTALIAAVLALLTIVTLKVLLRLFREFSPASLALVLERRFPKVLGDRLITAVELSDLNEAARLGYSRSMVENTIREARERVDTVPVNEVFDWHRLRRHGRLVLILTIGLLLLTGVVYGAVYRTTDVVDFGYRFRDVADVYVEREVLLLNTPWPRRAHLELLDFPESGDLRIGRESAAPKLRVQAYKWVIADRDAAEGWRPMTWADLTPDLLGAPVPELPWKWMTAPDSNEEPPSDPAAWRLDRVERRKDDPAIRARIAGNATADKVIELEKVFEKLAERAEEPPMRRTIRVLQVPETVTVFYWGKNSNNEMPLRAEADNAFTGVLGDLKESVQFRVRGEDYETTTRSITLVPPPMISSLLRDEFRPAYLYHRPPLTDGDAEAKLRGLKQEARDVGVSLSGGTSVIDLPAGTDVVLKASADKDLTDVRITPRAGRYPGVDAGAEAKPIPLALGEDGRSFSVRFDDVTVPIEFDFEFADTDGVHNKRTIQVKPYEDKPPEVEVLIEVLRKNQQGQYLCTPIAMVPFGGKVRDDVGLKAIEYHYTYTRLEAQSAVTSKGSKAAGFFMNAGAPLDVGGLVFPAMLWAYLNERTGGLESVTLESTPKRTTVEGFGTLYQEKGQSSDLSLENLQKRLLQPPPGPQELALIRQYELRSKYELFDLKKYLPELATDPSVVIQPRHRLRLDVSATDNNVIDTAKRPTGGFGPRTSLNKESFVLLVVSESELLAEIAREEEGLALKMEDVVGRLEDSQIKLNRLADQIATLTNNDETLVAATRSQEIQDVIVKARDVTQEISNDYSRILREEQTNRIAAKIIEKVQFNIVVPLDEAIKQSFPKTEEANDRVRGDLNELRKPSSDTVRQSQQALSELIEKLKQIQLGMGEIAGIQKLVKMIAEIERTQSGDIAALLLELRRKIEGEELTTRVSAAPVILDRNQKGKFTLNLKRGADFSGKVSVKFSVPLASELKLPVEVEFKEIDKAKEQVTVELTAGSKPGIHVITLRPTADDPKVVVESIPVKVTVR